MKAQFNIKEFTNASGTQAFRVHGMLKGVQMRKNFKTQAEAMTQKQNWESEALNLTPIATVATRLTPDQCHEAEANFQRLAGHKLTMTMAIDFALRTWRETAKSITVADAYPIFVRDKDASKEHGLSEVTKLKYKHRLQRLIDRHGKKLVSDITADDCTDLIVREGSGAVNRDTDRTMLITFFNWAKFKKYCATNPAEETMAIELSSEEPVIFTLAQSRNWMAAAQRPRLAGVTRPRELESLVPFVTLALFCALRVKEIQRLAKFGGWDNIDLVAREIVIGSKMAKGRSRRVVEIPANAVAFLEPYALKRAPIIISNMRHRLEDLRTLATIGEWTQDVMRHTAISFRLAQNNNEGATAGWAGNSPEIIHKHYRGMVKTADVPEFWNIMPGQMEIIQLTQIAA